jgi:hypothetical protein
MVWWGWVRLGKVSLETNYLITSCILFNFILSFLFFCNQILLILEISHLGHFYFDAFGLVLCPRVPRGWRLHHAGIFGCQVFS